MQREGIKNAYCVGPVSINNKEKRKRRNEEWDRGREKREKGKKSG